MATKPPTSNTKVSKKDHSAIAISQPLVATTTTLGFMDVQPS